MLCTNCGKEVPNDSEFCIYCGKRMEHEEDLERTIEVRDEEEEGPEEESPAPMEVAAETEVGDPLAAIDHASATSATSTTKE